MVRVRKFAKMVKNMEMEYKPLKLLACLFLLVCMPNAKNYDGVTFNNLIEINATNWQCEATNCQFPVYVDFDETATDGTDIRVLNSAETTEFGFWRQDGFNLTTANGTIWINATNNTAGFHILYNSTRGSNGTLNETSNRQYGYSTNFDDRESGANIRVKTKSFNITAIIKSPICSANYAVLYDGTATRLAIANFSGNIATFSSPVVLNAKSTYYLMVGNITNGDYNNPVGGDYQHADSLNHTFPVFPINSEFITWKARVRKNETNALVNSTDYMRDIDAITLQYPSRYQQDNSSMEKNFEFSDNFNFWLVNMSKWNSSYNASEVNVSIYGHLNLTKLIDGYRTFRTKNSTLNSSRSMSIISSTKWFKTTGSEVVHSRLNEANTAEYYCDFHDGDANPLRIDNNGSQANSNPAWNIGVANTGFFIYKSDFYVNGSTRTLQLVINGTQRYSSAISGGTWAGEYFSIYYNYWNGAEGQHDWVLVAPYSKYTPTFVNGSQVYLAVTVTSAAIYPATANVTTSLIGNCTATGTAGVNLTINYTWFKNEAFNSSGTVANIVPGTETNVANITNTSLSKGQNWTLQCLAYSQNDNSVLNSSVKTIQNSPPYIAVQPTLTNSTSSHTYTAFASVNDYDGDMSSVTISKTFGSCSFVSNSSGNYLFNVTYICNSSSPGSNAIVFNFTDSSGASAVSNNVSNIYPDNAANLSGVGVSTPIYTISTASCLMGNFTDLDGDTENQTARVYAWYKNGVLQAGANGASLVLSSISAAVGDKISCFQNSTNSTWSGSFSSQMSANETIIEVGSGTPGGGGGSTTIITNQTEIGQQEIPTVTLFSDISKGIDEFLKTKTAGISNAGIAIVGLIAFVMVENKRKAKSSGFFSLIAIFSIAIVFFYYGKFILGG